jgi:demethylmenaquinone methyltransferase/2-methoxy-6-polyprenyl-1,4-benzoquinol methylase
MLACGQYPDNEGAVRLIRCDALRLPLRDAAVDVVSCAFGVRNFQDVQAGLAEMRRVLRPGGRLVILEFAVPESVVLRWAQRWYTEAVLPRLGAWVARDRSGAYRYLPRSIETFDSPRSMVERLTRAGFETVAVERMNLGGVALYRAA